MTCSSINLVEKRFIFITLTVVVVVFVVVAVVVVIMTVCLLAVQLHIIPNSLELCCL